MQEDGIITHLPLDKKATISQTIFEWQIVYFD